jgi:hypothetical protein
MHIELHIELNAFISFMLNVFQVCLCQLCIIVSSQMPAKEDDWIQIANDVQPEWSFPNCVGAIDGKHIVIQKPKKSGSIFRKYKAGL